VVLGILAAVVIFALGGITGKSQLAACQADGATVSTAISAFNALNPNDTATSALLTGSTDGGPFIQSWPNATSYSYSLSGTPGAYVLTVKNTKTAATAIYNGTGGLGPSACGTATGGIGL